MLSGIFKVEVIFLFLFLGSLRSLNWLGGVREKIKIYEKLKWY